MKTDYKTADNKTIEIEVKVEVSEILVTFERQDASARRKARRHNEASIEAFKDKTGWEPTSTVDIETEYAEREEQEALSAAIAKLGEKQRRLVRLRYYENKTNEEIARELGVSRPAVTQQFGTIHKELKKFFEKF